MLTQEKGRLQTLINDALKDEEYQIAYFHQNALFVLNGQLQTLNNLADKYFDQKESIRNFSKYFESQINEETREHFIKYYRDQVDNYNKQLEDLNNISTAADPIPDNKFIDRLLAKLTTREINGFKLVLNKSSNFHLLFKNRRKGLTIIVPSVKKHMTNFILTELRLNKFKLLGFDLKNDRELNLTVTGTKHDQVEKMMTILSRIVFDFFYFKEFESESYIEINTKASAHH